MAASRTKQPVARLTAQFVANAHLSKFGAFPLIKT